MGGNALIKMSDLKGAFEAMGFRNVKTLLASGNVRFEGKKSASASVAKCIERGLEKKFKQPIHVIVRTLEDIRKMVRAALFKGIKVAPYTRLYVTFLDNAPTSTLKIPYTSPAKDFRILKVTKGEIYSVLGISGKAKTPEAMGIIEKEFGKKVTTRNWNTVVKIAKL